MQVEGAVVQEQGQNFAIVVVKQHVVDNQITAKNTIAGFEPTFACPVVLMAQDARGTPKWFGRRDIVNFMSNVSLDRIPWRKYTIN